MVQGVCQLYQLHHNASNELKCSTQSMQVVVNVLAIDCNGSGTYLLLLLSQLDSAGCGVGE
jgi:hypothetical protein